MIEEKQNNIVGEIARTAVIFALTSVGISKTPLGKSKVGALASIFTVVLSLFILGFFSIVILNLNKMADTLESQVQISVYLKDDLSQEEIDETKETLSKIEGLQDIKFTTREEAMENFKKRLGDQQFLLDALISVSQKDIVVFYVSHNLNEIIKLNPNMRNTDLAKLLNTSKSNVTYLTKICRGG